MSTQPTVSPDRRILLLAESPEAASYWRSILAQHAHVRVVHSIAETEHALREEHFDSVLCPAPELLPLTTDAGRDQARIILDGITQGVCSVDRAGKMVWSNTALQAYSPEVIEAIRAACAGLLAEMGGEPRERTRRRSLAIGQKYHFELTASALPSPDGQIDRIVGLVNETTTLSRMRERLDAIDAAGRELVALETDATARLDVPERLQLLEDNLIRYFRDLLDFTHFSVMVLDPQSKRLDTVLAGGFSEEARSVCIYASTEGNGICGHVAATGQSYICPDVARDPLYLAGFECAASSLSVPLRLNDRVVGVLNVESDQPGAFSEEDRQVAEIFGRYIAVALQMLRLLVVERSETSGQLAADVRAEVSEPLNNIISNVTQLLQDDAVPEHARPRLRDTNDQVDRVRNALLAVIEQPAIRGFSPGGPRMAQTLLGKRVLVADDEEIIRETIADVLAKAGALPVMASDGDQAVAMVRAQSFDLVLSDIKMPHKNGYEVFAAAKEVRADCPVVLITGFGYDPEHSIVRASREGLSGVLFKPFRVEQLMELVERAVAS